MILNLITNLDTTSSTSSSSTDIASNTLEPLGEFFWSIANATLLVVLGVAGIFLLYVFIYFCILLAKHKNEEERKEILGKFFWWVIASVLIIFVGSLSNILFLLIMHHPIFANPYSSNS